MILTKFQNYTPKEVIDQFSGKIQHKNMPALVEYLTNPDKAEKIEAFKEVKGELYFKVYNLWVKYGRPFKGTSQVLVMTEDELEEHDKQELLHILEYVQGRIEASKNIIWYIKRLPAIRITKLHNSGRTWHFDWMGFKIPANKVKFERHKPIFSVRPFTPFKKFILSDVEKSKKEWNNLKIKLYERLEQLEEYSELSIKNS